MDHYEIVIVDISSVVNVSNMIHNEVARQMGDLNVMFFGCFMLIIPFMICMSMSRTAYREPIVIKGEPVAIKTVEV